MHELVNNVKESRVLYIILHILLYTSTDVNAIDQPDFFMAVQENSNKGYPLMVAHHQVALEYSKICQKIIHSFEIDTC